MERGKLRLIIATVWIVGTLVMVAALTALAETVKDQPAGDKPEASTSAADESAKDSDAEVTPEEAQKVIDEKTKPAAEGEKKYVKLSVDKEALKKKLSAEAY